MTGQNFLRKTSFFGGLFHCDISKLIVSVKTKIVGNGLDRSEIKSGTVKTVPYVYHEK